MRAQIRKLRVISSLSTRVQDRRLAAPGRHQQFPADRAGDIDCDRESCCESGAMHRLHRFADDFFDSHFFALRFAVGSQCPKFDSQIAMRYRVNYSLNSDMKLLIWVKNQSETDRRAWMFHSNVTALTESLHTINFPANQKNKNKKTRHFKNQGEVQKFHLGTAPQDICKKLNRTKRSHETRGNQSCFTPFRPLTTSGSVCF